jgi:hypothetical protein
MLLIQYVHNSLSRKLKIPFQVDIAVLMLCVSVRTYLISLGSKSLLLKL